MAEDYASQLLGGGNTAAPAAAKPTDYAGDLLGVTGGKVSQPSVTSKFEDLPIANNDSDDNTAKFSTLIKANMVDDPVTKMKIFAKDRFPKLDEKEALKRYGVVEGKVVYVGQDGKLYREDPPGFMGFVKDNIVAGTVANAPAVAGAVTGAVLGAPGGLPGIAAGGALGAAGGKGYGKTAAGIAFDEPQTIGGNVKDMALEGLFEAGGNVFGSLVGKFLTKGAARDIAKLDQTKVADIDAKAADVGGTGVKVDLNIPQRTNLPSAIAKYDVLASMPTSREIIAADAQKTAGQANLAAEKFLAKVSPVDDVDEAGTAARNAAQKVIAKLTAERSAAAKPLYAKAFGEFQGIPPEFKAAVDELASRPTMKQAAKIAAKLAEDEGVILSNPQNSLLGMHYMKLALGDMIDGAPVKGIGPTRQRSLINMKDELVQMMDEFSPTYKQARDVYAHFSPNITSVKEGIISKVAGLKDEDSLKAAAMVFSDGRSPAAVERMRNLFEKSGLKDDWNALLGAHLRETFAKAGQEFKSGGGALNQAPDWRAMMVGNPRQYRLLEKAMDPQQFQAFNNMMDVFQAVGRTSGAGKGSQTMPRQEGARLLREEAGSGPIGQGVSLLSPQTIGTRMRDWLQEVRLGNHAEKLAEVMTSPDGMKRLKDLKRLSPNDQRLLAGASALFGVQLRPTDKPADTGPQQ